MKYRIIGETLPAVICELSAGEKMFSEVGGRSWVKGSITTETKGGGVGKMMGRMFTGESLFLSHYTANEDVEIAFTSSFPGSIRAYDLADGESIICQKRAFLAATDSVDLSTFMQKKLGSGLVGGEGFILQKITGPGLAFVEIDGYAVDYTLERGEEVVCDTGIMAVMDATCSLEVVSVKGIKNKLLGGEGFFDTVIKGPGKVTLQTMTVGGLASIVAPMLSSK
ncbi:AIM24 family protein [Erysipelothrix sp. HDW6C]|uniref:AIM24 family protein n=1 Tax=Erysipelothrix sp. HDW6C TaxID=2714930 RepID=UPI001407C945|nr:AIM24 family protein [Erysipelothrix sp. HDW6C]QIK69838.1 AIM24 family protein [Erysipelothrix sp. HDW6C]